LTPALVVKAAFTVFFPLAVNILFTLSG